MEEIKDAVQDAALNNEDNELEEENTLDIDGTILRLLADEDETELDLGNDFDIDTVQAAIRRLYLGGKIKKRKAGNKIFYKLAAETEDDGDDEEQWLESETKSDRKNISKIARKFRSCRYKVVRGYIAPNGMGYSLSAEKKGVTYLILYVPNTEGWEPDTFSKMLENDSGIRIVVPDNQTKLAVAKIFNVFVGKFFEGEESLLSFNREHSFRVLTIDQFSRKTSWKNLVK